MCVTNVKINWKSTSKYHTIWIIQLWFKILIVTNFTWISYKLSFHLNFRKIRNKSKTSPKYSTYQRIHKIHLPSDKIALHCIQEFQSIWSDSSLFHQQYKLPMFYIQAMIRSHQSIKLLYSIDSHEHLVQHIHVRLMFKFK